MSENYSLAVIIPNYNKEKYLRRCVESVLSQSHKPDEILIVDDCSTDSSPEIILDLANKYDIVKPIFLERNDGVSYARNQGIKAANSAYVTFLDSDDYYYADYKLEKEIELIKKYKQKGEDIVSYSATVIVDEEDEPLYIPVLKPAWFLNGWIFTKFISRIKTETIQRDYIISKEVIEKVGAYSYPEDFYEDLDLLFRLSKEVRFFCTYGYGTAYVQKKGGLSEGDSKRHNDAVNKIVDNYKKEFSSSQRMLSCVYKASWKIERVILRIIRKVVTGI